LSIAGACSVADDVRERLVEALNDGAVELEIVALDDEFDLLALSRARSRTARGKWIEHHF